MPEGPENKALNPYPNGTRCSKPHLAEDLHLLAHPGKRQIELRLNAGWHDEIVGLVRAGQTLRQLTHIGSPKSPRGGMQRLVGQAAFAG